MAEYIKRETAIKAVEKADYTAIADDADSCKADYLREIIESVPAADVVPVVHGEWIHHDDGVVTCSKCGNAESSDSYYCRYCGAKMDGGEDND
nr:MAG TPA: zinc-ribbon containing domain protein [Caudoviricetes sp.]